MKQYYQDNHVTIYHGCALDVLRTMDDCSVDSVVTDPPAGIAFMSKDWDKDKGGRTEWIAWMREIAAECLRVIKPGGHALVWSIPRTSHWTGTAWEDAGWQPREKIYHVFGSGFPKSMNISKQLDRMAGAEREVVGINEDYLRRKPNGMKTGGATAYVYSQSQQETNAQITAPATDAAKQWQGWGTALKPAAEEWWLLRKPLSEKTVAANVLEHGTGGLNIDGCRVGTEEVTGWGGKAGFGEWGSGLAKDQAARPVQGRWPANFTHDGSDEVVGLFPVTKSGTMRPHHMRNVKKGFHTSEPKECGKSFGGDSGSAARFFYAAKASKRDRDEGLPKGTTSSHPTVKATSLMRWLCRLVTPPQGIVLDPFMGSGSTGKGARCEGFRFIGIEREEEYCEIAKARTSKKRIEQEVLAL